MSEMTERIMLAMRVERSAWRFISQSMGYFAGRYDVVDGRLAHEIPPHIDLTMKLIELGTDKAKARTAYEQVVDSAVARAALEALRDPTPAVLEALPRLDCGIHCTMEGGPESPAEAWADIVQALLA